MSFYMTTINNNYERSGGNYSGYVPSGALEVAWKRKR